MTLKMDNLTSALGTPKNGKGNVNIDQYYGPANKLPISISRSKRPGRLRAVDGVWPICGGNYNYSGSIS